MCELSCNGENEYSPSPPASIRSGSGLTGPQDMRGYMISDGLEKREFGCMVKSVRCEARDVLFEAFLQ